MRSPSAARAVGGAFYGLGAGDARRLPRQEVQLWRLVLFRLIGVQEVLPMGITASLDRQVSLPVVEPDLVEVELAD